MILKFFNYSQNTQKFSFKDRYSKIFYVVLCLLQSAQEIVLNLWSLKIVSYEIATKTNRCRQIFSTT